jgi:DNA-binding transcriptional regulator YdaS (Cro superfamily)
MKKLSARTRAATRRREQATLDTAIATVGSASSLARKLGVSPQAVLQWRHKRLPIARCAAVETATEGAVQCEQLREDYNLNEPRPFRQRPPRDAIYLSGPMTGKPELNFPAFNAEAARLRNLGLRVINPAEVDLPPDSDWAEFMRIDLADMLEHCDTVGTLPGWERSKGASTEVYLARQLGMRVVRASSLK